MVIAYKDILYHFNMDINLCNTTKLNNTWKLLYHYDKNNWKLSGYKSIYIITSPLDFWRLYNNWDKLGGITNKHFFLMKNEVPPIWEDSLNINGGCWSFKTNIEQAPELWKELSIYLVCDIICSDIKVEIMGLSICLKKNNNCIIKIWNNNSKHNSLQLLNENILNKWGTDIIYIAHMSEN